ncbi:acyltransferase [Microbacterium stercoris]|uniref:Acyltransferase n=1 Tax=Microbacterium stercoris TaxID=2820289 RepID=A0A939QSY3_9MICO|nr:acyltransferase [Microbacterium stercoris]MBO3664986.1 acyltransferase [Microbacterium stercoris]
MTNDTSIASGVSARSSRRWSYDVLRVISIVGVVAIHTFAGMVSNPDLQGSARWWYATAMDIGFIWVVPVFVMLSGALLLAPRQHAEGPASFYRRRLLRLAPAFVFWQIFYIVVVFGWISGQTLTVAGVATSILDGRTYTHLYFLWLIVGLYAVAPVLAAFLSDGGQKRALLFAGALLAVAVATWSASSLLGYAGHPRPLTLLAFTQWLPYAGYFVAGWALRDLRPRGAKLAAATVLTAAVIALLVWQYGTRPAHPLLDALAPISYLGPLVALAAVGVFVSGNGLLSAFVPGRRIGAALRELSDASFGVFLMHFVILILLRQAPPFAGALDSPVMVTLLWIATVVISFGATILLRRVPVVRRVL